VLPEVNPRAERLRAHYLCQVGLDTLLPPLPARIHCRADHPYLTTTQSCREDDSGQNAVVTALRIHVPRKSDVRRLILARTQTLILLKEPVGSPQLRSGSWLD
jgi:hypothetical protein